MPYLGQTTDLTSQYLSIRRVSDSFRAVAGQVFAPGSAVQIAPLDKQVYGDFATVELTTVALTSSPQNSIGLVSDAWPGFNGSIGTASYTSPSTAQAVRGTSGVDIVEAGFHPAALIDQSGTGAVSITNGSPLVASDATAGYMQGAAAGAGSGYGIIANALLPSTGIGATLAAGALAQAAQTDTLTGTPAVGDTLSITVQAPYNTSSPGVVQKVTYTTPPLTSAQAASVTTAAAALVAYLNGQPGFSQYFTATNSSGVVTVTVNAAAAPFLVTFGPGIDGQGVASSFYISISGAVGNSLTFAVSSTGGTTSTAGGAAFTGGTGYKGTAPVMVV